MKITIILFGFILANPNAATKPKPCIGDQATLQETRGSLEKLVFESLRIFNCSQEFDPVFRVAMEMERNLIAFKDQHLPALLRVSNSQIEGQVREETKDLILAMAEARPGMSSLYNPQKAKKRLEEIYEEIPEENLKALVLLLHARLLRDRYPDKAEKIMGQFFSNFKNNLGSYSGAIASMFMGNILADLGKTQEAVALYTESLLAYKNAEMMPGISMEPYLIHGLAAALNANGDVRQAVYYLRQLPQRFRDYEGISTALLEIDYLEKEVLKESSGN